MIEVVFFNSVQNLEDVNVSINLQLNRSDIFKLIIIRQGKGLLQYNNIKGIISDGIILCFNELEQPSLNLQGDIDLCCIFFSPKYVNSYFELEALRDLDANAISKLAETVLNDRYSLMSFIDRKDKYIGSIIAGPSSIKRLFNLAILFLEEYTSKSNENWSCRSRCLFIEMLFLIQRTYENCSFDGDMYLYNIPDEMVPLMAYLHNNYMNKITLKDLSSEFHINRTTLSEKFNEVTGTSVIVYLNRLRINISAQLLRDTLLPITEIKERVGLGSNTHFNDMFKKQIGESPTSYRERTNWLLEMYYR